MKTVIVDKIASVTQACALGPELRLSNDIPAEEGEGLAMVPAGATVKDTPVVVLT